MEITDAESKILEASTILQRDSAIWLHERRKRLTASFFGQVLNKLPYTKCDNLVKSILYQNTDTAGMKYGRLHEQDAKKYLTDKLGIKVSPCGLFVNKDMPYLGATPDGVIDDDGIIEIKCPSSCASLSPEAAIMMKKFSFFSFNKKNNKIEINKKHKYYFQVQGQIHISDRKYCIFVLWTPLGVYTENIPKDEELWIKYMLPKLKNFYFDCLLPEIVDPRHIRSMEI